MSDDSIVVKSETDPAVAPSGNPVTRNDVEYDGARASRGAPGDDVELAIVTMTFDASDNAALLAILSRYTVLTRMVDGCRNVDLCSSATRPGRHLIVQKWDSVAHQQAHFDSELMVDMARSCDGILAAAPDIDLWEATSAHDLR